MKRSLVVLLALGACGGGGDGGKPDAPPDPPGTVTTYDVVTSKGTFTIETHHEWAPEGVDHFAALVDASFYDDARFFRVVSGFVAQFGINGTPAIDEMFRDQTIPDDPVVESNLRGFISYAQTSEPNSRTTQLFVNLVDNDFLDSMGFAPFAKITAGQDVADALDSEYGESPSQEQISSQGNAYLDANFPNLDFITSVTRRD